MASDNAAWNSSEKFRNFNGDRLQQFQHSPQQFQQSLQHFQQPVQQQHFQQQQLHFQQQQQPMMQQQFQPQQQQMPDNNLHNIPNNIGPLDIHIKGFEHSSRSSNKSDGVSSFLRAARAGNLDKILDYLNNGLDINSSNNNGLNALHLASKEGHIKVIIELLARGANVDAITKKGNTSLHIASLAGQEEVVMLLIDHGAKVNVQSQNGFTPLYMASQENHSEVVRFLLSSNANQGLATEDGFTPLAVALQQGHDKVVALLLENDAKGKVRLPALHIAAKKDDVKATSLLLQSEHHLDTTSKGERLINDTTKSGFTPLHIAAHYGNMNVGKLLVERGADVNYKARNSITPLHVASKWGRVAMIQLLLDNHADIEAKTRDGLTPLHCAARSGHDQTVDLLLEMGASVTSKTKNSLTPLHMAAQGDHVDCVRLLLQYRAVIDDVTIDYLTPLHVVAHCGNYRSAQQLLDKKCEVNARALNGFTPLHIACKKNRIKIVELLLKYGATIEATTESGLTPLHVASFMGHLNIVIYLLQKGANLNQTTVRGETALHLAARANQTDILRALLRNGAQIDYAKAREQQTPLHIVARLGNVDNLLLLLQHGASPDALTKDLYTPLHIAAKEGHDEVCQILLDHGAKQTVKSKRGFTPLHVATKNGHLRVVKRLIDHGANVDIAGKNGLTPLHVATHYDVVDVALYLLEKNANPHCTSKNGYTPLHIAAKKNEMEIALTLLQQGAADPNAKSKNGFTPLHLATQEGHVDMVALLLEHSASPNLPAKNGLVPLHLAAQEDAVPAAEILKEFGANLNQQTNAGYTPLHTACHFGQLNMVKFLIGHGAYVNQTTQVGYTPLHQAAQQGHVMVINHLLKSGASPDILTESGQSALSIAHRLGYISVVEILKKVTEVNVEPCHAQEKYKSICPETMQEAPMSDSENEGGEELIGTDPAFLYLANNDIALQDDRYKSECDAFGFERSSEKYSSTSSPGAYIDDMKYISRQQKVMMMSRDDVDSDDNVLDDEEVRRMVTMKKKKMMNGVCDENMIASFSDASQNSVPPGEFNPDQLISMVRSTALVPQPPYTATTNKQILSQHEAATKSILPSGALNWKSFLVSFMVDARGGAMKGCRHSGVRFIIPPNNICMPTRITCRLVKREKLPFPPPLMEGESLASRVIEMGPVGVKFAGLIIIEVPHFASLSGKEREILVLRSENGETWKEHNFLTNCKISKEALTACLNELDATAEDGAQHQSAHHHQAQQKRICRILSSDLPQYFALVTRIKQETGTIGPEGGIISSTVVPQVQAVFPEGSLTKNTRVGLQVQPVPPELVSKYGGNRVAVSSVVTIEPRRRKFHKPITLTLPSPKAAQKGMVNNYGPGSEAPSVRLLCSIVGGTNAALWEDITDSTPLVFTNNCVSFTTSVSARFWLMDCPNTQETVKMASDIYPEVTLVPFFCRFAVFARRTDAIEGRLRAFCLTDDKCDKLLESHDRFELIARSRDIEVLEGQPLYVEMAGNLVPVSKNNEQVWMKKFSPFVENRLPFTVRLRDHQQDPAGLLALMKDPRELRSRNDKPPTPVVTLNINLPLYVPMEDAIKQDDIVFREKYEPMKKRRDERLTKTEQWILEISKHLTDDDYAKLGIQLELDMDDIEKISKQFAEVNEKALVVMQAWTSRYPESATGAHLEEALKEIGRSDLAELCPCDVINVTHAVSQAASKVFLDATGFEALRLELGASSKGSSITRGMSLDVSYDEQDLVKDSGSTMDELSDFGSADKFGSQDGVDDMKEDVATPTKEELPTPTEEASPVFEDDEALATIKRKPKAEDEEAKIFKKVSNQVEAIPIEIPIVTKVITESRLSEIESSYEKQQARVVNKLNPEPEFELTEQKKPPGYVKDQVRKWEHVLTIEGEEVDIEAGELPEGYEFMNENERLEARLERIHADEIDSGLEETSLHIAKEVILSQEDQSTSAPVFESTNEKTRKIDFETIKLQSSPETAFADSTVDNESPETPTAATQELPALEAKQEKTYSIQTEEHDYVNWEKRSFVSDVPEDVSTVSSSSDGRKRDNAAPGVSRGYPSATMDHLMHISFEEKDLIKQSDSTDEDDESSQVGSVIDRSELAKRQNSSTDDASEKEMKMFNTEEASGSGYNKQHSVDMESSSDVEAKESRYFERSFSLESPMDSHDLYKYRPDTDSYECKKNKTHQPLLLETDLDEVKIDLRSDLKKLCRDDEEAAQILEENLIDTKNIDVETLVEKETKEVFVEAVVRESPTSTCVTERVISLPDGTNIEQKTFTTTETTTFSHKFFFVDEDVKPSEETRRDDPASTTDDRVFASVESRFTKTTEHLKEESEEMIANVSTERVMEEGGHVTIERTTVTRAVDFVVEKEAGMYGGVDDDDDKVESDEEVIKEGGQEDQKANVNADVEIGECPEFGPMITVTEDNSSPVDDDDFVGYYGLQSYMREQHDDSDVDIDTASGNELSDRGIVDEEVSSKTESETDREAVGNYCETVIGAEIGKEPIVVAHAVGVVVDVQRSEEEISVAELLLQNIVPIKQKEVSVENLVEVSVKGPMTESVQDVIIIQASKDSAEVLGYTETFDESLTRKLSEHIEKEAHDKKIKESRPVVKSLDFLSFPEICVQAASPMAQSPEEECVMFEVENIEKCTDTGTGDKTADSEFPASDEPIVQSDECGDLVDVTSEMSERTSDGAGSRQFEKEVYVNEEEPVLREEIFDVGSVKNDDESKETITFQGRPDILMDESEKYETDVTNVAILRSKPDILVYDFGVESVDSSCEVSDEVVTEKVKEIMMEAAVIYSSEMKAKEIAEGRGREMTLENIENKDADREAAINFETVVSIETSWNFETEKSLDTATSAETEAAMLDYETHQRTSSDSEGEKDMQSKADEMASNILDESRNEIISAAECEHDDLERPTEIPLTKHSDRLDDKTAEERSFEDVEMSKINQAINISQRVLGDHILDSPPSPSDFTMILEPGGTSSGFQTSVERDFVKISDSDFLLGTSTSSIGADFQDGSLLSKEIESIEEKDVDEKELRGFIRTKHARPVGESEEEEEYADDTSDSTRPEKGIGENEKEFAEDEEFEKMDTRDGDELSWVRSPDLTLNEIDEEEETKSSVEIGTSAIMLRDDVESQQGTKPSVKRVSSDSDLADQGQHSSQLQLGFNFQHSDFPRAPFHTPVRISPSDSSYEFSQVQTILDAERAKKGGYQNEDEFLFKVINDQQKQAKKMPYELKPEDLEKKLSSCGGGSESGEDSENEKLKPNDDEEEGKELQRKEVSDASLIHFNVARRRDELESVRLTEETSNSFSPVIQFKPIHQELKEIDHDLMIIESGLERLSTSSSCEPIQQNSLDSSLLPESFKSPPVSPLSDLTFSGTNNNIFSGILSSETTEDSFSAETSRGKLSNIRVGLSPSEFISEVDEEETTGDPIGRKDRRRGTEHEVEFEELTERFSAEKALKTEEISDAWPEDDDYCYVSIENVKNLLYANRSVGPLTLLKVENDSTKDDAADRDGNPVNRNVDVEKGGGSNEKSNAFVCFEDDVRSTQEQMSNQYHSELTEPCEEVDELYKSAVLENISRFCGNVFSLSHSSSPPLFSEKYTINKLRCKQLSDELTDDVCTPEAVSASHTPQSKVPPGRFGIDFFQDNPFAMPGSDVSEKSAAYGDIGDDSDLCMQKAIQESLRSCKTEPSNETDMDSDYADYCPDQLNFDRFKQENDPVYQSTGKPHTLSLFGVPDKKISLPLNKLDASPPGSSTDSPSPQIVRSVHRSSSSATKIEENLINLDGDGAVVLLTAHGEATSMSSEEVPEASTSSDTSAEPTILAATYDLELGAVSRVVAAYDISPDAVDKKMASIQVESTLKRIMSSPEDDVFEQQTEEAPVQCEDIGQEAKSDVDGKEDENSREDEEDVTVRSVSPSETSKMPEEQNELSLSPSWDTCPELDNKISYVSSTDKDANFFEQVDEQSFDESATFDSDKGIREETAIDQYPDDEDEDESSRNERDYKSELQATNICSEKYSLSDDFSSTISPMTKHNFQDWRPDGSDVFTETQLDDEDINGDDRSSSNSMHGLIRSGSNSETEVAADIDFVITKAEKEDRVEDNENDSLEYYCWKPRQPGEDCDDSSILSSNTEASYGSYCLNSNRNNGSEIERPLSPLPVDICRTSLRDIKEANGDSSYSAEEEEIIEGEEEEIIAEDERGLTPQSETSENGEKKLSEVVMDMMDEMKCFDSFDLLNSEFLGDKNSLACSAGRSTDFVSQQLSGKEKVIEEISCFVEDDDQDEDEHDNDYEDEDDDNDEFDDEGLERSDSFEEVTEEMLMERKAEEFVSAVIREAYMEKKMLDSNADAASSPAEQSSSMDSSGRSVRAANEWETTKSPFEKIYIEGEDDAEDVDEGRSDDEAIIDEENDPSQEADYSEAVTKSISSDDDMDHAEEGSNHESNNEYEDELDDSIAGSSYGFDSYDQQFMTVKKRPITFSSKLSPKPSPRSLRHQARSADGQKYLNDSISPDDQGDSSSLDSFATVIATMTTDECMGDFSSMASSMHSDILPYELSTSTDDTRLVLGSLASPGSVGIDLSCPVLSSDFSTTHQLHAQKERSDGLTKPAEILSCRDNTETNSSEESALDSDAVCLEDEDGQSSSVRSDEEMSSDSNEKLYGDRMMVVEYCDTMLATIREEEERLSSLSGKTSSSSSARLAESKQQQQLLQFQQQQQQQQQQQPQQQIQQKKQQQKSVDKDTASVSSSLLEFERLERELQDKSSNADSNGSLKTQDPRRKLESSSNETDEKASSSHSGDAAADDNVSISSSLAEFEQLEDELKQSPSSDKAHVVVLSSGNCQPSNNNGNGKSGLMGSNTSLQSFSMVGCNSGFETHQSFGQSNQVGSSLLEDFYDLTNKRSEKSSSNNDLDAVDSESFSKKDAKSLAGYPEYQDIVQIIRDATQSDQFVPTMSKEINEVRLHQSVNFDELNRSPSTFHALENSAESGAWSQTDSSFIAVCTNSQASLSNLVSLEDSLMSSALEETTQVSKEDREIQLVSESEKFAKELCDAVLKSGVECACDDDDDDDGKDERGVDYEEKHEC